MLLEPEDGAEGTREENSLDGGEHDEAFAEVAGGHDTPVKGPVNFA
jgi:hypothetical protein